MPGILTFMILFITVLIVIGVPLYIFIQLSKAQFKKSQANDPIRQQLVENLRIAERHEEIQRLEALYKES